MIRSLCDRCLSVAITLKFLFVGSSALYAQDDIWQGPTTDSSWFTPANWTLGIPTSAENATVANGTTAQIAAPTPTTAVANILTIMADPVTGTGSTVQLTVGFSLNVTTLSISNGGTFQLSGAVNVSTPVEIGAGATFQVSTGGTENTIDFHDNGTLLFDGSNSLVSNVSGTGQLVITGTGTVLTVSSVSNTYNGATTINPGAELLAGSATGLSPNSAFIVNSAPGLDINGFSNTIGSLSGTGIVLNNGTTAATLTVGNDNTSSTFDGSLQNGTSALGLIKIGAGTLILTGNNIYNGGTTISAGTLQLGNGGTTGSIIGDVIDNGVLSFDRNDSVTFDGLISGVGSLTKAGLGMLILTGVNTYSGGTNLNAGVIAVNSDANLGGGPLSFDGGTLEALTGITSTKTITLNAGGGTFLADPDTVSTLSGSISGAGSLTKSGAGTLVLAGVNTYTGGTSVLSGTLQAGSATGFSPNSEFTANSILDLNGFSNTIGSLSGTGIVLNNGTTAATLTVGNDNTSSTFDGSLQNGTSALGLIKIGAGTLILTGNNIYNSGTTISAGILQLGNGGTTGSIVGDVIDNGVLSFDRSDSVTFDGLISGVGSVNQIGTGTTILTANNTYTGGTTIGAGTLQLGDGGTSGSIVGDVIDNGVLAFDRSDSVTFPGVISGTGSLVQQGAGVLTLPNENTYTGTTTVNNGSLIVDGSIASEQTFVNSGGTLGGHGTIGGNLINNGIVSQLSSPGTLTVLGDYIQNAGGTLKIGVGGLAANQHDLLAVNGHVTLDGTLQVINLGNFSLQPGDQFVFVTANKGVTGNFGTVLTGTIVQVTVTPRTNDVLLEAKQGAFAQTPGVATTPNQSLVAKALDSAAGDPRAATLIGFLNSQPLANLPQALDLIAPTEISSINSTAVSLGKVQIANLGQRLANIRGGSTGFSSSGFAISAPTLSLGEGFAGVNGPEGKKAPPVFAPSPSNRWGVFVTGLGEFTNVEGTFNAPGYDISTGGFTLGVDYRLTPNFAIGLTAGYAHTSVHPDGGGNIDVNGGKIGLYATAFANGFYLDTAVSGGPSGYNMRRTALEGTASGSTDGGDVNVLVAAGYDWRHGNLTLGPTASFQFSYVGFDAFTETGSLAPLKFPYQNSEAERTAFGAKASYEWQVAQVIVIPQLSAAWQHEYGTTEYSVVASFANGAGNSFTVQGPPIGRDSLLIGAGAAVIWNDRVSTYLYYDGEVACTRYQSHDVTGGVRISF